MSEMGSHHPFGHLKHKLRPKEGLGVKLAIWLLTIKSQKFPLFTYVQVAWHIPLKSSWQGLQLWFKPHFNQRSAHKIMGPKVAKVPILGISGLPLGSPRTKWHLGVGPMARHRVYYKGEGGGFPQVRAVVSLISSWLLVVHLCTKMLQLCTNQLVVGFVQVRVNDWIDYQFS